MSLPLCAAQDDCDWLKELTILCNQTIFFHSTEIVLVMQERSHVTYQCHTSSKQCLPEEFFSCLSLNGKIYLSRALTISIVLFGTLLFTLQ